MFTSRVGVVLPSVLGLLTVTGCNQILGIHQPIAEVWIDGGTVEYDAAMGSNLPQAGSGGGSDAGDAGPVNQLPRSDYASPTWPMPNPVASQLTPLLSYGAAQSGVVPDNVTKLEWQQQVDDTTLSWDEATAYCDALEIAGADDWRLPSRIELISLIDFSRVNPSIDLGAFPDAASEGYWSASPFVGAAKTAWGVHFDFTVGIVFKAKVDETYRVRCVRSEPIDAAMNAPTTPRFTIEAGAIHDAATKLDWQQAAPEDAMTWREATDYCNALMLNGAGWHLPSIKDLHALVDETREMPAIDAVAFPGTPMDYQWSSSMYGTFSDNVWALSFSQGFDLFLQVAGTAHVRCVRL